MFNITHCQSDDRFTTTSKTTFNRFKNIYTTELYLPAFVRAKLAFVPGRWYWADHLLLVGWGSPPGITCLSWLSSSPDAYGITKKECQEDQPFFFLFFFFLFLFFTTATRVSSWLQIKSSLVWGWINSYHWFIFSLCIIKLFRLM